MGRLEPFDSVMLSLDGITWEAGEVVSTEGTPKGDRELVTVRAPREGRIWTFTLYSDRVIKIEKTEV